MYRPCDVETLHLDHSYSKTITDKIEEGNDVRNPSVHKNEICSKSDSPTIKQTCLGKPDDDHITKDAASPSVMERERPNPPSGTSSSFAATNETSSR